MRMSETKRQEMYGAIHDPVMILRVEIQKAAKHKQVSVEGLDDLLFGLVDTIWNNQKDILGLTTK